MTMKMYYRDKGGGEAIAEVETLTAAGRLRWYTNCYRENADEEIETLTECGGFKAEGAPWPPGRFVVGDPAPTAVNSSEVIASYGVVGIYRVEG